MLRRRNIVIAGGGYVGLYCALRLERLLRRHEAEITVVCPENFMLYQPLLPDMAAGTIEPRQIVVPLRDALRRSTVVVGRAVGVDTDGRTLTVAPLEGPTRHLGYDHLVVGLGSVSRVFPIPGLKEHAIGFKSIDEALYLRHHVLSRLDVAESTDDAERRRRALTFVVVGGGYTGVELVAEMEDLTRDACRNLRTVRPRDIRWLLVEATEALLPTVSDDLSRYAGRLLRGRGIDVRLGTEVEEATGSLVRLSGGGQVATDTLVWVAGVEPHPFPREAGLPVDDMGRIPVDRHLRVTGVDGGWSGGDCAAVPAPGGGTYPATAQHAQREGRHIADNIAASCRGRPLQPFDYQPVGELLTVGRYKGVGELRGRSLKGVVPWLLRRGYYLSSVPTVRRKLSLLADWLANLPFRRDVVHFGRIQTPAESLRDG